MPAVVILATGDKALADAWTKQVPVGRHVILFPGPEFTHNLNSNIVAIVVLDASTEQLLPDVLSRYPTIFVGEPRSLPFEQAKLSGRAKTYLTYGESANSLGIFIPLVEELAEKQSMLDLIIEKSKRSDLPRSISKDSPSTLDAAELWDFLEGAVENLDSRDRLITEFRRASRQIFHASHSVFFTREADGFRADRGTSYFPLNDPIVPFLENHPVLIDGDGWEGPSDPIAELSIRNRLALWGARLLAPVHDNGRLLGLIAFGIRDDGQAYDKNDKVRAIYFARLLRHCLAKSTQLARLSIVAEQNIFGSKYLPSTLVLGPDDPPPRHAPLVVRDLIGKVRRNREAGRVVPADGQPFRASAGLIVETGGVWATWEEASSEIHDATARQRAGRRGLLREVALTLSHELGNGLVSLTAMKLVPEGSPLPTPLLDAVRSDILRLERLNRHLGLMQTLHEISGSSVDVRIVAKNVGKSLGIDVEVGPEPVVLVLAAELVEFGIKALIETIVENRHPLGTADLQLQVRSSGALQHQTALLSIKGRNLELEGILPEPIEGAVPNQGQMGVFLAKEIFRLHRGEIHAGPGLEGTEILVSLYNLR